MYVPAGGPTPTPDSAGLSVRREYAGFGAFASVHRARPCTGLTLVEVPAYGSWTDHTNAALLVSKENPDPQIFHTDDPDMANAGKLGVGETKSAGAW